MHEISILVFGLAFGACYSLLALGLILTYRMSRFLNLAHGALAMLVTFLFWQFAVDWGWNPRLAGATALLISVPIGILLSTVFLRPLLRRPDATKIAASVVIIILANELVRRVWGSSARVVPSVLPISSFEIGGTRIRTDHLLLIGIAAVVSTLVGLGLTKTRLGVQIRAVAEDRDQAGAFGIAVTWVDAAGWALATLLAGAAGILIAPLGSLDRLGLTFLVVTSALAAATVGRLVSVGMALVGAALLGIVQAELARLPSRWVANLGTFTTGVPFLILVVALAVHIARGQQLGPASDGDEQGEPDRTRTVPRSGTLRFARTLRAIRRGVTPRPVFSSASLRSIVLIGAVAAAGLLASPRTQFLLTLAAAWTIVFVSVGFLNGLGGQVSLCQAAFMGIGALVSARVQTICPDADAFGRQFCSAGPSWRVWAGLVAGVLAAAVGGLVVAVAATRVRGVMLAVATLAFGFFMDNTLFTSSISLAGGGGIDLQRPPGFQGVNAFWLLIVVVAASVVIGLGNVSRSGSGRVLRLLEQSPTAARSLGIHVWTYKLAAFALSAAVAGLGGALLSLSLHHYAGFDYNSFISLLLFAVAFAVGTRWTGAAVVAGLGYVFMSELLNRLGLSTENSTLVFGLAALVSLGLQGGMVGAVAAVAGDFRSRFVSYSPERGVRTAPQPGSVRP